ncbi:CarD-like/TRCF RNAP-interacting domain-containing protein, partial [Dysosmobacter welbionis]
WVRNLSAAASAWAAASARMRSISAWVSAPIRCVILSIPFILCPLSPGSAADVDNHEHGGQQGQDRVELHRDAQHHALGPVVGLLGQQVDGPGGHAALGDGREQAAQRHGQAGHEIPQPLLHGHIKGGAVQQPHAEHREKPHHQAVQTLGAGDHLEDHHLAELAGILAQKPRARLACDAGAFGRPDAREDRCQTS